MLTILILVPKNYQISKALASSMQSAQMSLPMSLLGAERLSSKSNGPARSSILGRSNISRLHLQHHRKVNKPSLQVRAGLFDNIFPAGVSNGSKTSGKGAQLAEELIELAEPTDAGFKASAEVRERIAELVRGAFKS